MVQTLSVVLGARTTLHRGAACCRTLCPAMIRFFMFLYSLYRIQFLYASFFLKTPGDFRRFYFLVSEIPAAGQGFFAAIR